VKISREKSLTIYFLLLNTSTIYFLLGNTKFRISTFLSNYCRVLTLIGQEVHPDSLVLDLAAGTGILALELAPRVRKVYGIDISPQMVDLARAKAESLGIGNTEFATGDAYQLSFADEMFDVVVVSNALHVMIEPERALAEARRVLKRDGRLIVPTFCHGENYLSRLVCRAMNLIGFKAFQRWSSDSFVRFIEANGYEALRKEVFRDIIPLTYLVAKKGANGNG
jgi:phosphatidylethanolamine/phosphatidyl-N-methylethanolamine N-methyltransferase